MALIKCQNCGSEVSSSSKKCIHCNKSLRKKKNGIIINIFVALGVLLFDFIIVVILLLVVIDYQDEWIQVVDYYDENTNKYLCSVEYEIEIEENKVVYSNEVIKGHCDIDLVEYKGTYEYDFWEDRIDVDFYNTKEMNKSKIYYYYDYICEGECNIDNKYYRSDEFDDSNRVTKHVDYYDESSDNNNNLNEQKINNSINYNEFMYLYNNKLDNTIIIIRKEGCPYCENLIKTFDTLKNYYNVNYYVLDINSISENEKNSIMALFGSNSVPITVYIKNGVINSTIGSMDYNVLVDKLKEYGFIKEMIM